MGASKRRSRLGWLWSTTMLGVVAIVYSLSGVVALKERSCSDRMKQLVQGSSTTTNNPCPTDMVDTESLLNDPCPLFCQNYLDSIRSTCKVGISEFVFGTTYQEAHIYNYRYASGNRPLWKSCDFGYQPTRCDTAVGRLQLSRFPKGGGSIVGTQVWPEVLSLCEQSFNVDTCSAPCRALLDAVVTECVQPDPALFAAHGAAFHQEQQRVIPWRTEISLQKVLGENNDLSEACWGYYLESSTENIVPAVSKEEEDDELEQQAASASNSPIEWAAWATVGAFSAVLLLLL